MGLGVVCRELSGIGQLKLEEVPRQPVGSGEVRIETYAAGVNFPDVLTAAGRYQIRPELPFVVGMEAAGVITEIGSGVTRRQVGQQVMCWAWNGCFAEDVVVPEGNTLPMPSDFTFAQGAAFMIATSTATNGLLQRARLGAGEVLLVHAAGSGVGLAAVEVGKLLGARVIATASEDAKLALAHRRGADALIDYTQLDFREEVLRLTDNAGADVVFDIVGGDVFDESLRCTAWGGRVLVVGFASGKISQLPVNHALLKCVSVVGVRALEHTHRKPEEGEAYRRQMLEWVGQGHLRPEITEVLPLPNFREALFKVKERSARGRIVLKIRDA